MIKSIKITLIAFLCVGSFAANAQKKITEGSVTYTAEYDLPPDKQMMASMLPSEYKTFFKDELTKFTLDMGMMTNVIMSNSKTSTGLMLMDIPAAGQKIAVKLTPEDKEKQKDKLPEYDIIATQETKTLAGYKATKYLAKDKKTGDDVEIWTSTEIEIPGNDLTQMFKTMKGTPLEFKTNMNGIKVKMTVKEIKPETIAAIDMKVPEGYKEMTMDELMAMSGQ